MRSPEMTPDVCLILLSALLAAAGYLFWVGERLPRTRALLGFLALVALAVSVVVHDVITSRQATSAEGNWDTPANHSPA